MNKFHPQSYSHQARGIADRAFTNYKFYNEHPGTAESYEREIYISREPFVMQQILWTDSLEYYVYKFTVYTHRAEIVRMRAAKRLGRKVRKWKENK